MEMYARFNRSFAQLDAQRALNENWTNATAIESALLLLKVGWLTAANDTLASSKAFGGPIGASYTNAEETLDVLCSDQGNAWYGRTLEDLRAPLGRLERQSIVGESHALRKQHLRPRHAP
ncbi:Alpha beta hydrolase fold family [Apiospora saccharicola]|uniref:Alpha beta hydrolase fold family n=1 Tax=Apiospora saccharicola TaxID=335842 RepID=A0ABR1TJ14_9PEZI